MGDKKKTYGRRERIRDELQELLRGVIALLKSARMHDGGRDEAASREQNGGKTREDEIKTKKEGTMPPEEKGRKRE